jgi:quercetin dioxygenase-like cupin family protein
MPSIDRPLAGEVLVLDLAEERGRATDASLIERSGRVARTLLKSGPLRLTLVILGPGGETAEHEAAGPITVQALEGTITFTVGTDAYHLGPGELLAAAPGIRHSVSSERGGAFLLTVAQRSATDATESG